MIPALNVCAVLTETLGAGVSAIRERRLAIEDAIVAAAACDTAALRGQRVIGRSVGTRSEAVAQTGGRGLSASEQENKRAPKPGDKG